MPKIKKWNVEIEGQPYEISYKPNIWSGKGTLNVNGKEIALQSKGLQALAGIDVPIMLGGKQVRFVRVGQRADIAVDGVYLDSKKEYKPIGKVGELTNADTSGFTTAAGSNKMYKIEVTARSLPEDKPYVRLKAVESVDGAVAGGILAVLTEPRYGGEVVDTVLT